MKLRQPTRHILLSAFLFFLVQFAYPATWYVTPTGAGLQDGTSWTDAEAGVNLQTVIDNAGVSDEVWVACGTYTPTNGTDRTISFSLRQGVTLYGSFVGTETMLSERTLACGPCSILSGEIGVAGNADNSYKVVRSEDVDATAIMDGFTIRDGNDSRSPSNSGNGLGGGLYNHGFGAGGFADPTIRNCLFTNNRASWGAGAFNNGYGLGSTAPTFVNCIFYQNHSTIEAGGMDSYGVGGSVNPTVINTLFYENTADLNVGAMYVWGGTRGNGDPGTATATLINTMFINNSAPGYGGAFISDAQAQAGGFTTGSSAVTLENCIAWGNSAGSGDGPQFYIRGVNGTVSATYSDIDLTNQTGAHVLSGATTGNLNTDPMFTDINDPDGPDDCWFTTDDGLMLLMTSPLVDAGSNTNVHSTDILGNARIDNMTTDIGSYERQDAALPVSLMMFEAQVNDDQEVELKWHVGMELNNDYYTIEHSTDGKVFSVLDHVPGAGNSNWFIEYNYLHERVTPGVHYYKLKQTDFDGTFEHLGLREVEVLASNNVHTFIDHEREVLVVINSGINETIEMYSMSGQKVNIDVLTQTKERSELDISILPTGTYVLVEGNNRHLVIKRNR